jgi:ribonucleoside-diphosphate reductase alpha chain
MATGLWIASLEDSLAMTNVLIALTMTGKFGEKIFMDNLIPIAQSVWEIKYRNQSSDKPLEQSIEETWQRVATAVAKAEKKPQQKKWQKQFYDLLENFRFLPGGRILAGAGTAKKVNLFNCFVMKIHEDSLSGIFDALKEGALTLQEGGGVGYDFSVLRPYGQLTTKTGSMASGPVSFMRIWDSMSATMQSSGARRGAMMGVLRCDHPDIEKFITAKSDPKELRQFNVSVIVTDEFMHAVKKDTDWELVFPIDKHQVPAKHKIILRRWSGSAKPIKCQVMHRVRARDLWQKIIKSAYAYAEPGVIFADTINRMNPLWYCEWLSATNPCGEIPLPPYGACNLGSINLTQFVEHAFTEKAKLNWHGIANAAALATRFLDNVIDISQYPLASQKRMAIATRRIGLGLTGLADALVMLGLRYGSPESLKIAKNIMKTIAETTWETSIELARERKSFPYFNKRQYLQGKFVKHLSSNIQKNISRYGMRNSHHNAIAPTGTISLLANNVSNGLEPIYSGRYHRKVRTLSGEMLNFEVTDYALLQWQQKQREQRFPPTWVDVQGLQPEDHLQMQAAVQPYIDNAISKTINLAADFPFERLHEVYSQAYRLGLKGCTIFRPNPITGSILSTDELVPCCST